MAGVATGNVDSAGGTQISQANPFYTINDENVVVIGDVVAGHDVAPHDNPVMAEGEPWYRVNTIPVSREGHLATCGHPTTGQSWYQLLSGAWAAANPTLIKARKGTYFYGGAGMNGAYIHDLIASLRDVGVQNVRPGNFSRWSFQAAYEPIEQAFDASAGITILRDEEYPNLAMGIQDYGITGSQFNLIGYSYGGLVAAQVAIKYARQYSGQIDNLVLIGTPISSEFLSEIQIEAAIMNVHIIDLSQYGDPIYAGISGIDLLASIPTLVVQLSEGDGHFYYSKDNVEGEKRRDDLANIIYQAGIR